MQMGRNMIESVKFVYIIIICFSLYLVAIDVEGWRERCFRDSDCPRDKCRIPLIPKCMYQSMCKCVVSG
ncbi:hypothetical protein RYX36_016136, partial [Vicia faba]